MKVTPPIIKHYKVFSEVNEIAKKHEADLVIMGGSHGADGLSEIFIGSNAEKVVRTSDIPVIVVKEEMTDFKIDRFVFACDFELENLSAFARAKQFAKLFEAELNLVYVNTPPGDSFLSSGDAYKRINKFLNEAKCTDEVSIHNDYSVETGGVINYSENNGGADALAFPPMVEGGDWHIFLWEVLAKILPITPKCLSLPLKLAMSNRFK